ncbi:DUF1343 domain-containing protein [Alteromonas sp. ASW11-19]|uniref:DUF1343 domain-containing protein n=1 Tax=Alteromonas salexigens TaxID=2982530 RepID=A0ABT2VJ75_9ALTE|nr:DUF1343 domain-containing protein [Alteromonas salexigens]MCU7553221.1 DUF1343 domain-containing protein [Alteromonas salexigens]
MKLWLSLVVLVVQGVALPLRAADTITVGAERPGHYLPALKQQRVSLVVNQTSRVGRTHLVDYLLEKNINVVSVMAPEHGFRGNRGAGEVIDDGVDPDTGIPVLSIYGANKKPTAAMLANVDMLIFDIQDVGARFYTYISTLHYVLEAAAEQAVPVIVLDRPNPHIASVDGPVRAPDFASFVGVDPLPVLHGMTVGELAKMMKGEGWISSADKLDLQVVPVANYHRNATWSLPVPPSPNLPNDLAIRLYPSLCFFEGTAVSIGRGTAWPFQLIGHHRVPLGDTRVVPESVPAAPSPKLAGEQLFATRLTQPPETGLDLAYLLSAYRAFAEAQQPFFTRPDFFDKLAGTDALRQAILRGESEAQIRAGWQPGLVAFRKQRQPYLLYPDNDQTP